MPIDVINICYFYIEVPIEISQNYANADFCPLWSKSNLIPVLDSITVTSPQGHIVQGLVCTHGDGRSASAGRDTDRPCFLSQC